MLIDFTKIPFDVLIQAGQSNAEGYGFGDAAAPYFPDERVWYLSASYGLGVYTPDYAISCAREIIWGNETVSNFALSFAAQYVGSGRLAEGRRLLIVRAAVGGTGFIGDRWTPEGDLNLRMLDMIRTALALNPENRLIGLLWHQGENEVICGSTREKHYADLTTLLTRVRQEFACPDLPFVAADFVQDWKGRQNGLAEPIADAIRDVCRDCGHARFVETDGLTSNYEENGRIARWDGWEEDYVHFSRAALYELGERYFAAFEGLTQK